MNNDNCNNLNSPKQIIKMHIHENNAFSSCTTPMQPKGDQQQIIMDTFSEPMKIANNINKQKKLEQEEKEKSLSLKIQNKINFQKSGVKSSQFQYLKFSFSSWSWKQFIEFFLYHIIFYFLLGPLTILLLWYKPGIILLKNLEFYSLSFDYFMQNIFYLAHVFCTFGYFYYPMKTVNLIEIVQFWLLIINNCIIIASKYATFSPDLILLYKTELIKPEIRKKQQFLHFYIGQCDEVRFIEIQSALKRMEFEIQMFFISFFVPIDENNKLELNTLINNLAKFQNYQLEPEPLFKNSEVQYILGHGIINKLIQKFEEISYWKKLFPFSLVLSIILTLLPLWFQFAINQERFWYPFQTVHIILLLLSNLYCTFVCILFIFASLRELKKKQFFMSQCKQLLTAKKKNPFNEKIFPTINIADPLSIKGFSMIRQVCFDYGYQYQLRAQAFFSFIIFVCLIITIILNIHLFRIYQFKLQILIYATCLIILFISMLIALLFLQASLNEDYNQFNNYLEDWKTIILDMIIMKKFYFEDKISKFQLIYIQKAPQNYLHKKLVEQFITYSQKTKRTIEDQIYLVIQGIEDAQRALKYEERNHCLKLYGIKITFQFINTIIAGYFTLFAISIEYYFSTS